MKKFDHYFESFRPFYFLNKASAYIQEMQYELKHNMKPFNPLISETEENDINYLRRTTRCVGKTVGIIIKERIHREFQQKNNVINML